MKKPNLPPGKWTFSPQTGTPGHCICAQVFDGSDDELYICSLRSTDNPEVATDIAKAIKELPNLIDVLIEFVNCKAGPTDVYENAVAVLKRAGCSEASDQKAPLTEWEDAGLTEAEFWKQNYMNLKKEHRQLLNGALEALKEKP